MFTVVVGNVNQPPTLDALPSPVTLLENATPPPVSLTGLSAGPNETQGLTVTASAVSQPAGLITNLAVTYTGGATGSLSYGLAPNASGTATITVTVKDDGGTANGGVDTFTRSFNVTVTPVNQQPTLDAIADPPAMLENATTPQTINLTGITAGPGDTGQFLTVVATSDNTALIPDPSVTYTSPSQTGSLVFTPLPNAHGTAKITVKVMDNGGTANNGKDTVTRIFTVTVTGVNQAPTLDTIFNPTAILENAGLQTVNLSGISAGNGDSSQNLTVTASSSNTALIPNPTVAYHPNDPTGSITYTPVANQSGTAVITVTVKDDGGTASGGIDTVTKSFTVTVTAVNQQPTLDAIPDPAHILENDGQQRVDLTGITAGPNEPSQSLTVTATSDNTALIPNPTVAYTSPNSTGFLTYTPTPFTFGTAKITVTLKDNGGTANGAINTITRTFTVAVDQVNQTPTLSPIAPPPAIFENAGQQSVSFSGVTAGATDTGQNLTVTATSDNTALIPNPTVTYTSPQTTGSLTYIPVANASGTATITVKVKDDGGTAHGATDFVTQSFVVTVTGVNQAPTIDPISNPPAILENAGQQTVNFTGVTAGVGDTSQGLSVTAVSSNTALIPNPTVTYTSPNSSGVLTYQPTAFTSGSSVITVTVTDTGNTANGGINTVTEQFTVSVLPVNQQPTLSPITDPAAILENSGTQSVSFGGVTAGTNETQNLFVSARSSNTGLIPDPSVSYTSPARSGTLSYTPTPFKSGTAVITVTVMDGGGTANNGIDTVTQQFTVTVTPVNQPPTLDPIANPAPALENSTTPQTLTLTGITAGRGDSQNLTVTASSSNPLLIPTPTISYASPASTATLSFTPAPNASGSAVITVKVKDDGGTSSGGDDTVTQSFTVNVTLVNQAPSFTASNPPAAAEDSGPQTVVNFATFSPGGGINEANQTASYIVTNVTNPGLFAVAPSISPTGTLTYTPAPGAAGSSGFTVTVMDNGGTANGGHNTSPPQSFTLTINPVNHAPTFVKGPNQSVLNNAGPQTVAAWATGLSAGPSSESGQALNFLVSNNNTALFATQPAVAPDGTLTYTPAPGASGTATVSVQLHDSGGTANGGSDTSSAQIFTITVNPVIASPQAAPMAPVTFVPGGASADVVVAMFTEANGGPASEFTATINWGDGTPPTAGIVRQDTLATATSPAVYSVLGHHTYASSGAFPITVTIIDLNGGTPLNATNVAVASSSSSLLTAALDASSDSGASNSDGITNVKTPSFSGNTLPGARVTLSNGSSIVATGTADGTGHYQLVSSALADGSYNFSVTETSNGTSMTTGAGTVVIDTTGPRITSVVYDPKHGQFLVTYVDDRSGLSTSTLTSPASYQILSAGKLSSVTSISSSGSATQQTATLHVTGKKIKSGSVVLTFGAQGHTVTDLAGNALTGNFFATPPGGNAVPAGPAAVKFTIKNGAVVLGKVKKKGGTHVRSLTLPGGPHHLHAGH
jgi:hypothetical protein